MKAWDVAGLTVSILFRRIKMPGECFPLSLCAVLCNLPGRKGWCHMQARAGGVSAV